MSLWLNLKRDKHFAIIYYKGEKIAEIRVDEQNRGNVAFISLDASKDVVFKVTKENNTEEQNYNSEEFNK